MCEFVHVYSVYKNYEHKRGSVSVGFCVDMCACTLHSTRGGV